MIQNAFSFSDDEKRRAKNNAEKILHILEAGPASSPTLIGVTHRFSACIRNLRERGHVIDVLKQEDGTSMHYLRSFTPMVEVTEAMQDAYYQTEHWKLKRNERFAFDNYHCCHCRSREKIQVHHWVYELFAESLEDLVTLCDTCHERIHNYDCVKAHFPRFVTEATAAKLQEATR